MAALGLAAFASLAGAEAAETVPRTTEHEFFAEVPLVLTASRLAQNLHEVPGAMTVIDRETIAASGFREVADLFRLVPGMYVGWGSGHFPAVSYHAYHDVYARMMQVLVDGRSVYTPYFAGGVDWTSLPLALDDIERIEVFRGTNSVAYGSNAFLGIINIITRHAALGPAFRVEAASGSKGINDRMARVALRRGGQAMRFTYGLRKDRGLDDFFDSKRAEFINYRGDFRLGGQTQAMVQFGAEQGKRGEGFPNLQYPPHTRSADMSFLQLRLTHAFAPDNELTLHYYQNRESAEDHWTAVLVPPFEQELASDRIATRQDFEAVHRWHPLPALRLAWGSEVRRDAITSELIYGTPSRLTADLSRIFANAEWRVAPALLVNAGLMHERYELTDSTLAYRVFANLRLAQGHTLRGGVSTGYRTPSLFEERGNWRFQLAGLTLDQFYRASGGLKPEHVVSEELGYLGEWPALRSTVDLRVYRERIRDTICRIERALPPGTELSPDSVAYDFGNCPGRFDFRGYEVALQTRPWKGLRIVAGYFHHGHLTRSTQRAPAGAVPPDRFRAYGFPSRIGSALLEQKLPHQASLSVGYYAVSGGRPGGPLGPDFFTPSGTDSGAYTRIDVRLAKQFRIGATTGDIAVVHQNLGDDYIEFHPGTRFTRRWFVTLALEI